jgi:hypothetical protein
MKKRYENHRQHIQIIENSHSYKDALIRRVNAEMDLVKKKKKNRYLFLIKI